MIRLFSSFKQAFRQIGRNKGMTLASVFAITAMLLILGLFFVTIINVNMLTNSIKEDYNNIQVFLKDSVKKETAEQMRAEIATWEYVDDVTYRTKDEAMHVLKKRWGENGYLLDSIAENPLPNSLIINMTDLEKAGEVTERVKSLDGVEDVTYYKETVDKLLRVTKVLQTATVVIIVFLIIVSIVVVSNTIKLTVINRSDEIEIMKYVGATNWYIRGPFMLEGIIIGAFSAGISAGIVSLLYGRIAAAFSDSVASVLSMPLVPVEFLSYNLVQIFLALGISIGAWGSIISMRRFLDT